MVQEESFEDLLSLLFEIERTNDEVDGAVPYSSVIRRIGKVLTIIVRVIKQLVNTFVSCAEGTELVAEAGTLGEITSTLVTITVLIEKLLEQDGAREQDRDRDGRC